MPKRKVEEEINPNWRYASVTMTKNTIYFLDELAKDAVKVTPVGSETFNGRGTKFPSRREIVQDALHLYIKLLFPERLKEYEDILKDDEKLEPMDAHIRWFAEYQMEKIRKAEAEKSKE